jgi:transcription initiation factor TFIIB
VVHNREDLTSPDWLVTEDSSDQQDTRDWLSVSRVHDATEQRIVEAFAELEALATCIPLSLDLREQAAGVYCDAFNANTTDGRDTSCAVAASVRLAALASEQPIPVGRLTTALDLSQTAFRRSLDALKNDLDRTTETPVPADYVSFLANDLGIEEPFTSDVREILKNVSSDPSLVGKDPAGIAAAAVYLIVKDCTQAEVADAAGISTETVRQRTVQLRGLLADD